MTTQIDVATPPDTRASWTLKDAIWILGLYGTTVGAGTLFLPVEVGTRGPLVLILMLVLGLPLALIPHVLLCRVYMRESQVDNGTLPIFGSFFSGRGERAIMLFYCVTFFPVTLVYGISLVNALNDYFSTHLHLGMMNRGLLSFIVIAGLYAVLNKGRDRVVGTMSALALPFACAILFIALIQIPLWDFSHLTRAFHRSNDMPLAESFKNIWLTLPLITFSFCCAPLISPLASYYREKQNGGEQKAVRMIRLAYVAIFFSIIFFVLSCVLSISHETFVSAKAHNLNVLSVIGGDGGYRAVYFVAPFIAIIGMMKSFLGVSLSVAETFTRLLTPRADTPAAKKRGKLLAFLVMFGITFGVVYADLDAITLIETICGPLIAILLFLIPTWLIYTRQELRALRGFTAAIVVFSGLATLSALFYAMV
ncbi:AAA family ATPase [Enterobacteriaceae bacterium BIT-l23]|uniref:amino acid permease n=1 Tax=Jejubacter TaxID=2815296 RepID=UPI001585B766|nr:amino acid permease [Jejubacter calystegiae]NUU64542.1 AAA family ATPase [Enterobacteriaceae bacterium BIT-l23]